MAKTVEKSLAMDSYTQWHKSKNHSYLGSSEGVGFVFAITVGFKSDIALLNNGPWVSRPSFLDLAAKILSHT